MSHFTVLMIAPLPLAEIIGEIQNDRRVVKAEIVNLPDGGECLSLTVRSKRGLESLCNEYLLGEAEEI